MDYIKLRKKEATTDNEERMLQRVAEAAANTLTPIETHSICVLLSIAFGTGTMQSRIFARHVNPMRRKLGLPQITHAAAGNPTMEEKMKLLQTAVGKLSDDTQALLLGVLLHSPLYRSAQSKESDEDGQQCWSLLMPRLNNHVLWEASVQKYRVLAERPQSDICAAPNKGWQTRTAANL